MSARTNPPLRITVSAERLNLWAPYSWARWGPMPVVEHVPTKTKYRIYGVVLREHDLVPCALYAKTPTTNAESPVSVPDWTRPLVEILEGPNWEWDASENPVMSSLALTLAIFNGEDVPADAFAFAEPRDQMLGVI